MNYGRLVFAFAVLGLAACAPQRQTGLNPKVAVSASAVAEPVGTFKFEDINVGSGMIKSYLTIDGDSVTATTVCKHAGEKIKVQAKSPAQVSKGHFSVAKTVTKSEMLGGTPCTAQLEKGVTAFEVQGPELFLTPAGGETYFYGFMIGKRPSASEMLKLRAAKAFAPVKRGYDAVDQSIKNVPGDIAAGLNYIDPKIMDGVVANKDAIVNAATVVKDGAIASAVAVKDGFLKVDQDIKNAPRDIKTGLAYVDQKFNDGAVATKNGVIFGATKAKEAAIVVGTAYKDSLVFTATKIKEGAIVVGTVTKDSFLKVDQDIKNVPSVIANGIERGNQVTHAAAANMVLSTKSAISNENQKMLQNYKNASQKLTDMATSAKEIAGSVGAKAKDIAIQSVIVLGKGENM